MESSPAGGVALCGRDSSRLGWTCRTILLHALAPATCGAPPNTRTAVSGENRLLARTTIGMCLRGSADRGSAERVGFEPTVAHTDHNGFRDRLIQPHWHLSEQDCADCAHCRPEPVTGYGFIID